MSVFQTRRLYRLLSWDYVTHEGVATDGTKFEGQFITFTVLEKDVMDYNGHLLLGEVFSAEEKHRVLFDIVVEKGPRAVVPGTHQAMPPIPEEVIEVVRLEHKIAELTSGSISGTRPNVVQVDQEGRLVTSPILEARLTGIEGRVEKLERKATVIDDHK